VLWALRPRLATKLQRPYLCRQWNAPERCAALLGHYEALPHLLAPAVLSAIYKTGVSLLRILHTDSSLQLDARLFYQDQFEKEGELTLGVEDTATGLVLAGLTFSLVQNAGRRTLIIGGVQGSPDPRARNLIHDAAKYMHGLRVKALAFWCIQELATCWDVFQIQAVDDEQHIYRHRHKRRTIAASYDEFWAESEGHRFIEGGWELPRHTRERCREELKPSRRRAHEKRYLFLSALRTKLHRNIAALSCVRQVQQKRNVDWRIGE
jgi:uncharacterized protein VirK/YbjX